MFSTGWLRVIILIVSGFTPLAPLKIRYLHVQSEFLGIYPETLQAA